MATNVLVTGLPGDSKFPRLVYSFKNIFKKVQIRKFWIRELADMYGSDCKQMTVEFPNTQEAYKARNYLDNYRYTLGKAEYRLMASIDDGGFPEPREEREWGRSRRGKRERPVSRSPSPGYRREASKLDLEIELLRKQRQVIEEERRLLLERKKLEMIREYGPSVTRDFDDFEPPRKRRHPSEMEIKPPRKHSPPRKPVPKNAPKGLPTFFQPCKRLIAEMRELINKDTTNEERHILIKLIRAALRKNLVIALDGKGYMPTEEILKLYRVLYPKSTDEVFVGKILANIRASYLANELEGKTAGTDSKSKGDKKPENSEAAKDLNVVVKNEIQTDGPNVEENSEDKQETNEKKTGPEEKPVEENETDAAAEVKSELNESEQNTTVEEATDSTGADDAFIEDTVGESEVMPENGAAAEVMSERNTSVEAPLSVDEESEPPDAADAFVEDTVGEPEMLPENGIAEEETATVEEQ